MVVLVVFLLLPLAAAVNCPEQGGACPNTLAQGLLQASRSSNHGALEGKVSTEIGRLIAQGEHVDLVDVISYVQRLSGNVATQNYTMSETEKKALMLIKQMVGQMQKASEAEHIEDQSEIYRMQGLINNCSSDAQATLLTVTSLKNSTQAERDAHATCCIAEVVAKNAKNASCSAYDSYRKSSAPPVCLPTQLTDVYVQATDKLKREQMETCLIVTKDWLTPLYDKYAMCESKSDLHDNQTAACNKKQQTFEQAFCAFQSKLEDACDEQTTCRSRTIAARNNTYDGVKMSEAARKADVVAGKRLECFLAVLEANMTKKQSALRKCQNMTINTSSFIIDYPQIPSATSCVKEQSKPCDDNWTKQEYQSQTWYTGSRMQACVSCPSPPKTTTSTTLSFQAPSLEEEHELSGLLSVNLAHICAIPASGTTRCWTPTSNGALIDVSIPQGARSLKYVRSLRHTTCGLRTQDNKVTCWNCKDPPDWHGACARINKFLEKETLVKFSIFDYRGYSICGIRKSDNKPVCAGSLGDVNQGVYKTFGKPELMDIIVGPPNFIGISKTDGACIALRGGRRIPQCPEVDKPIKQLSPGQCVIRKNDSFPECWGSWRLTKTKGVDMTGPPPQEPVFSMTRLYNQIEVHCALRRADGSPVCWPGDVGKVLQIANFPKDLPPLVYLDVTDAWWGCGIVASNRTVVCWRNGRFMGGPPPDLGPLGLTK
jgi:hypothetical protein